MSEKTRSRIGRNELCPCGSSRKFKKCHGRPEGAVFVPEVYHHIDTGEPPVRWVISNDAGTAFFADKKGSIMVFSDKALAVEIARLEIFSPQVENEINVAGVGATKWEHLQNTLPYIEVPDSATAVALINERIADKTSAQEIPIDDVAQSD
jgi:hypothetical protein